MRIKGLIARYDYGYDKIIFRVNTLIDIHATYCEMKSNVFFFSIFD